MKWWSPFMQKHPSEYGSADVDDLGARLRLQSSMLEPGTLRDVIREADAVLGMLNTWRDTVRRTVK